MSLWLSVCVRCHGIGIIFCCEWIKTSHTINLALSIQNYSTMELVSNLSLDHDHHNYNTNYYFYCYWYNNNKNQNTIENRWVCLTESITVLSFMFLYCVNLMPMYVWMYVSLKMWICLILCNGFLLAHKCDAHTGRLIALVRQWYLYLAVPHFVSLVF